MMKWFLFLAAFLPITPTMTKVVDSVSDCSEFLLEGRPPQIPCIIENDVIQDQNRYKPICQTYNNKKRFLTVYDTKNRIPVFSAYKFKNITSEGRPKKHWMIEPQLLVDLKENMMTEDEIYTTQAINRDYENNNIYDRGHLYPNSHGPELDDKESTYTLTNVVPQAEKFNGGSWSKMETCVKCVMEKVCISNGVLLGFVVVGAHPTEDTKDFLKQRVNIPTHLWSAFCCHNSEKKWFAGAHWAPNTDKSGEGKLPTKTVKDLNNELNKLMSTKTFNVFPGEEECLKTTVTEFSQELQRCGCN